MIRITRRRIAAREQDAILDGIADVMARHSLSSTTIRKLAPIAAQRILEMQIVRAFDQVRMAMLYACGPERPSIASIQDQVCRCFDIDPIEMQSDRRAQAVARPRQVAMYLSKKLTTKSLPAIGRHFGGRDHTTVIYACRQVEKRMGSDPELAITITGLAHKLEGTPFAAKSVGDKHQVGA